MANRETAKTELANDQSAEKLIMVEVAYAEPHQQWLLALNVAPGTTAWQAVVASGLGEQVPRLKIAEADMGIFSRPLDGVALPLPADYVLQEHDRVEIYRPLTMDPKEARLLRAARAKKLPESKGRGKRTGNKRTRGKEPDDKTAKVK